MSIAHFPHRLIHREGTADHDKPTRWFTYININAQCMYIWVTLFLLLWLWTIVLILRHYTHLVSDHLSHSESNSKKQLHLPLWSRMLSPLFPTSLLCQQLPDSKRLARFHWQQWASEKGKHVWTEARHFPLAIYPPQTCVLSPHSSTLIFIHIFL